MAKKKPRVFKFKNTKKVEYELQFRKPDSRCYADADGICYNPDEENPKIYIRPQMDPRRELNTCIHEIAHAFFWDKSETEIERFASTASHFLYKVGWRKTHRPKTGKD